ncbi:MAG: SurA N-terminal domain-containing protein [Burkholderiaceae bacterium]
MFDFVRKHNKTMQILLFLVIVPSFLLVGIDGYQRQETGASVATVAGQSITQSEWDNAHKNEVERLRQAEPSRDIKLLDSPQARYFTLERLIRDRVLAAQVQQGKLVITDQRLESSLRNDPSLAQLRKPDGSLDIQRLMELLGSQGMTPETFMASARSDLASRQVVAGVSKTAFVPAALADLALNAFLERREIQVLRLNPADYYSKVNTEEAQLLAYYQANPALFQAPEQADIEYLVLDLDAVKKGITLAEPDLRTYYEQNAARLGAQEERRVSHILIATPKTASASDREKAKNRANELLAVVQNDPQSFAEVAMKNSQDPSAASGGDLDYIARGATAKPFEDAAYALKPGAISGVVETEYGYHIIKLADIKVPKQRSFDEMRAELEADLKKQQAQRKFAEEAETFTNAVYDQPEGLKPIAERLKLELKTATNVVRTPNPQALGLLANTKFLAAVFSPESVDKKRNTGAIEIASSQLVSGRITKYTPARTREFAEVREQVRQQLLRTRGSELAQKEGLAKLAAFKSGSATDPLPNPVVISRDEPAQQSFKVLDAALRVDATGLPAWIGVDLGAQGYAVVRVNKLVPRANAPDTIAQGRAQYGQWLTATESLAYYNVLKTRFKTQSKITQPDLKAGNAALSPDQ